MKNLENYRKEIDEIDFEIINLLARRMSVVDQIGECKSKNKIPVINGKRFREIIDSKLELAKKLNIDQDLIKDIFQLIHDASVKRQKR